MGTDLIGERFTIVDEDTLDLEKESRVGLDLNHMAHIGRSDLLLNNRFTIGTSSFRGALRAAAKCTTGSLTALGANADVVVRRYHDTGDGLRSHVVYADLRGHSGTPLALTTTLGVESRIGQIRYSTPSSLQRSSWIHSHDAYIEWLPGWRIWQFRVGADREIVPDSTGLGYIAARGNLFGELPLDWPYRATIDLSTEIRRYKDTSLRPHFGEYGGTARFGRSLGDRWSLSLTVPVSIVTYQPADSVYANTKNMSAKAELEWMIAGLYLRAGPEVDFQRSSTTSGEDYYQWAAALGVDTPFGSAGFMTFSASAGRRSTRQNYGYKAG